MKTLIQVTVFFILLFTSGLVAGNHTPLPLEFHSETIITNPSKGTENPEVVSCLPNYRKEIEEGLDEFFEKSHSYFNVPFFALLSQFYFSNTFTCTEKLTFSVESSGFTPTHSNHIRTFTCCFRN